MHINEDYIPELLAFHRGIGTSLADKVFEAVGKPDEVIDVGVHSLERQCKEVRDLYNTAGIEPSAVTARLQNALRQGFHDRTAELLE